MMGEEEDNGTCSQEVLEPSTAAVKVVSLILSSLTVLTFVVLGSLFLRYRRSSRLLSARADLLTLAFVVGSVFPIGWAADSFLDREGFPCVILSHLNLFVISLQITPRVIAVIQIYFKVIINQQMAKFDLVSTLKMRGSRWFDADAMEELVEPGQEIDDEKEEFHLKRLWNRKSSCCWLSFCSFCCNSIFTSSRKQKALSETLIISDRLIGVNSIQESVVAMEYFPPQYVIFLASKWFALMLQTISFALAISFFAIDTSDEARCTSPCDNENELRYLVFAFTGVLGPVTSYFLYKLRNEIDPMGIIWELQMTMVIGLIFGFGAIVLDILDPGDLEEDGRFLWELVWVFASWLQLCMSLGYPLFLVWKIEKFKRKHGDDISLSKVLESKAGRNQFKAFLVGELSVENYLFWQSSSNYKESFNERTKDENRSLRSKITEMYVNDDAQFCVNIKGTARTSVLEALRNDPLENDFDEANAAVLLNMEGDSFPRFRRTSEFKRIFVKADKITLST